MSDYSDLKYISALSLKEDFFRAKTDERAIRAAGDRVSDVILFKALERELDLVERLILIAPVSERDLWFEEKDILLDELSKYFLISKY